MIVGRKSRSAGLVLLFISTCAVLFYFRHIDWPSLGGENAVREYLPDSYPLSHAHHYTLRNFMDSWELYRFSTSHAGVEFLAGLLNLEPVGEVQNHPLIVSTPPPYWWQPEQLDNAMLFSGTSRAGDGFLYEMLYADTEKLVYLIRFDG